MSQFLNSCVIHSSPSRSPDCKMTETRRSATAVPSQGSLFTNFEDVQVGKLSLTIFYSKLVPSYFSVCIY